MNIKKQYVTLFITAALMGSSSYAMHLYQQTKVIEKQQEEATKQLIILLSFTYPTNTQEKDNLITKIKELLVKGANPDGDQDGNRPLVWAARSCGRYVDPVRTLLEHGANPNIQDWFGNTALIDAAQTDQVASVSLLLERGAKSDIQDHWGSTALICAANRGHSDTTRVLLEHGANTDIQANDGKTALLVATQFHNKNIMRLLLAHQAKPNIKNHHGDTALLTAIKKEEPAIEIIRLLLEDGHADPNIQDKDGNSPLHLATHNENIVSLLFEHEAKPNLKNNAGNTALINFIKNQNQIPSMPVQIILENEANPNIKDTDGATALHYAARYGHAPIAKLLLEYGADPLIADNHGVTALLLAAQHGQKEIASQLIKYAITLKIAGLKSIRAEKDCYLNLLPGDLFQFTLKSFLIPSCLSFLNGANDVGNTPLHVAAQNNDFDMIKLLLEHGADKTYLNNEGKTALDIAKEKSYKTIIDLLQDKPAENPSEQDNKK